MTKLKKDLKKILLTVLGVMLLANAGYDFARFLSRRQAEHFAVKEIKENPEIADARAIQCYNVADIGWLCDMELTTVDGRKGRVLQVYSYEDLAGE